MVVCILAPRYPFPEKGGDVLRINSIGRYFKSKGYKTVLVSFIEKNQKVIDNDVYDETYTIKRYKFLSLFYSLLFFLSGRCIQCGYYYSPFYNKMLKNVLKKEVPDIIVPHMLRMVPYLEKNKIVENTVIEMTDALSKTYQLAEKTSIFSLKSFIYRFEKKRIKKYEKEIISKYSKISLVSPADIAYLGNQKNLYLYPLGVNTYDNYTDYNRKKICFIGNMRTLQNQEAVKYFIQKIFPKLQEKYEDLQFHIVGAEPPEDIINFHNGHTIFVTGFVESVFEYIKDSCFAIAPVSIAAGVQYKVLTSMATKIPVVLSSLIASAIPQLKDGENCFICDNETEYVEKAELLINDKELRNRIAEKGYTMIKNEYSVLSKLEGFEIIE